MQLPEEPGKGEIPPLKRPRRRLKLVVLACILAGAILAGYFSFLAPRHVGLKVGEEMIYGIYIGDKKIGTLTTKIEGIEVFDNVNCYVSRYMLTIGNRARGGRMKFDEKGELKHVKVALAENLSLKWSTEIAYSIQAKRIYVIIEDNRSPEFRVYENIIPMRRETMISEFLWYLLRIEPLSIGYEREFDLNVLPDAMNIIPASLKVAGEEMVVTPAGAYDCSVVEGENTSNKIWVAKDGRVMAKFMEKLAGAEVVYILESYKS
jgi:hypothetical protein